MFSCKEKFAIRWSYPSRFKLNLRPLSNPFFYSKILFVSLTFKSVAKISVVLPFKLNFFGTVKPRYADTRLIRTTNHYGQLAFSLGRETPHFSSKFNPLNTDTPSLVPGRSRRGQSWTLPSAVTSQRDTRRERVLLPALSQTSRGQRVKRERLGTRLGHPVNKKT